VAAVEAELSTLESALNAAEADAQSPAALEVLLTQVIDRAVERRRMVVTLLYDPLSSGSSPRRDRSSSSCSVCIEF